ncbi:MAG: hypothetical protein ACOYMH_08210 [Zwartia sp.]
MAQTGYTPISIYYSSTASAAPTAGNLVAGELAINTADGKLFYKDSAGVVQVIGTKGGVGSSSTTQVLYNSSGLVVGSANMTFSGTALTLANDASISGLTVGKGGGAVGSNSAFGPGALSTNTTGAAIVAVGYQAFATNTTGANSTAVGYQALVSNTTASSNTAVGYQAGYSNTTGTWQTMFGYQAGYATTTGSGNAFYGYQAGLNNTTGVFNVFVGRITGTGITTGFSNTIVGDNSGSGFTTGSVTNNSFFGSGSGSAITSGSNNSILGCYTGNQGGLDIRTASNYIVLSDGNGNPRHSINSVGVITTLGKSGSENRIATGSLSVTAGTNTLLCTIACGSQNPTSISIIFEVLCNNGAGNDGYACSKSTREILSGGYSTGALWVYSQELHNSSGSLNASVINTTVTTSASVASNVISLYANSTQTGVAATTTNTMTYKVTVLDLNGTAIVITLY